MMGEKQLGEQASLIMLFRCRESMCCLYLESQSSSDWAPAGLIICSASHCGVCMPPLLPDSLGSSLVAGVGHIPSYGRG